MKVAAMPAAIAAMIEGADLLERLARLEHGLQALCRRDQRLAKWLRIERRPAGPADEPVFAVKLTKGFRDLLAAAEAASRDALDVHGPTAAPRQQKILTAKVHARRLQPKPRRGKHGGDATPAGPAANAEVAA